MPTPQQTFQHFRRRREKVFGDGRPRPLDRNAKSRIMFRARGLMRRTEKGRHYGQLTAKDVAVLEAVLCGFHNSRSGLCFPSYERIAEAAGCARSTVAGALKALERAGLLTWLNRLARIRERCEDLFGKWGTRIRVIRTSNAYQFIDPLPPKPTESGLFSSKSDFQPGTTVQEFIHSSTNALDPSNPLDLALLNFGKRIGILK